MVALFLLVPLLAVALVFGAVGGRALVGFLDACCGLSKARFLGRRGCTDRELLSGVFGELREDFACTIDSVLKNLLGSMSIVQLVEEDRTRLICPCSTHVDLLVLVHIREHL